jgi:hypothetical protein
MTAVHRRCLQFVVVALLVATIAGGLAAVANRQSATANSVVVSTDVARPDFPDAITFELVAETEAVTERVELLYSLAHEEKLHLATPEFEPSSAVNVMYSLDMTTKGIPAGIDITYRWRLVGGDGSAFETQPAGILWEDDRFEWDEVSTDQVTVYAYNNDNEFNREILDTAQRTVDKLEAEFGINLSTPIRIWAYESIDDFEAARLANTETWSAALAYPELNVVLAVLPAGNSYEVGRVVPHEISHQVLHQATMNPFNHLPTWLDEGLAVMNQETGKDNMSEIVRAAAAEGRLFSIRALNSGFPYDSDEARLAYAESLSVVTFIIDLFGADKMAAYLAAYKEGLSHDDAARKGLGVDLDELDRLWKESLGYQDDARAA